MEMGLGHRLAHVTIMIRMVGFFFYYILFVQHHACPVNDELHKGDHDSLSFFKSLGFKRKIS